jgi:hypothetical protein
MGRPIDFARWYWTPPVTVQTVFKSETERIKRKLGLRPLVSLTDHNDICTAKTLQRPDSSEDVPISLEWTVPVNGFVFHLGVHNLPSRLSMDIVEELVRYTRQPTENRFVELLSLLNGHPETLVVLNHPLSDLRSLGNGQVKGLVTGFLNRHNGCIHALEINGYRAWSENQTIVDLAEQFGLPIVSGGDRHFRAPNAVLNLSKATSFSGFVSEVRKDKISDVLVMPEYREDLLKRKLESVADFFRYHPDHPQGQKRWRDRVFVQHEDGFVRPLSHYWNQTAPTWVKPVMWFVCLMGSKYLRMAFRTAFVRRVGVALWEHINALPS